MQMEDAGHEFREEDRASLGCRVGDVALSAPSFYSDYVRGEINDPDAFSLLSASAPLHACARRFQRLSVLGCDQGSNDALSRTPLAFITGGLAGLPVFYSFC